MKLHDNGIADFLDISEVGIADGLVAWYPLNGDAKDHTINRNDGTVNGATVAAGVDSKLCYSFDGVDDSIVITGNTSVPTGNASRTISGWFSQRGAGSSDMKPIIWIGTSTYLQITGIGVRTSTNCIGSTLYGGSYENDSSIQATIGRWFFVAATYKTNGDFTLYVDGSQAAYRNIADPINTSPNVYIGREPGGRSLNAYIQDVRIYNRALSAEEIKILYDLTAPTLINMKEDKNTVYVRGEFQETL